MDETPPTEEAHDLASHDSPLVDSRSPSFVSLNDTGNTGGVKQHKSAVLEQPTNISESPPLEEYIVNEVVDKSVADNKEEGVSLSDDADETGKAAVSQ